MHKCFSVISDFEDILNFPPTVEMLPNISTRNVLSNLRKVAAGQATRDGRNGNKNNIEFARKNYEINQLIERLKSGQQVDMSEIDQALEPTRVW